MALPDAWRTGENHVATLIYKFAVEMLNKFCFRKIRLKGEVERFEGLKSWKFSGSNPCAISIFLALRDFKGNKRL